MINIHISNLISRLNNRETDLKFSLPNNTILYILDNLELKGFINYNYNPYTNEIFIFNNNIKHIIIKSKPSRHFYVNKNIYKLNIGNFLYKQPANKYINSNIKELLLYVE
jgi:hypothetical protein